VLEVLVTLVVQCSVRQRTSHLRLRYSKTTAQTTRARYDTQRSYMSFVHREVTCVRM
jgi:hypothetical protein